MLNGLKTQSTQREQSPAGMVLTNGNGDDDILVESGSKTPSLQQEGELVNNIYGGDKEDASGREVVRGTDHLPGSGEESMLMGRSTKTYQRRRKTKGLLDLGDAKSHPRRSVRISSRNKQVNNYSLSRHGLTSVSLSDGDIDNCNTRLGDAVSPVASAKLWEISRRVGITCQGDEQQVLNEYSSLEARDLQFMESLAEGKRDVFK